VGPMRAVYDELYGYLEKDGLPASVAEAVATSVDGLWFYWLMRLRPVDQNVLDRLRGTLERIVSQSLERPDDFKA